MVGRLLPELIQTVPGLSGKSVVRYAGFTPDKPMTTPERRPVKAIVVGMFQPREHPGELTHAIEGFGLEPLDPPVPVLSGHLWENRDLGLLALEAGVGPVSTAVSIMALAQTDRYDLRHAFWLISGIAGGDPAMTTLGDVVWVDTCVDGDLAFEIDAREIPNDWDTGIFPLASNGPWHDTRDEQGAFGQRYEVQTLNSELANWAYELTEGLPLRDDPALGKVRSAYASAAEAQRKPLVRKGAVLSAARFWHGAQFNAWARKWVRHWTRDAATFTVSGMEDSGTLYALRKLSLMGKVEYDRVLLQRSVSNFTLPPSDVSAHENLRNENGETAYPGMTVALENAWIASRAVLRKVLG